MTTSIRVRPFCLAFRRNQDCLFVYLINKYSIKQFAKKRNFVLFFTRFWVQKRKNLKVLHGRHNGIVDWHLGIRLGLLVAYRHRTHTSYVLRAFALVCFRIERRSYIDVCEQVGLTQEPNSSHSLAPLGYPSNSKNHREPFLLPGASCPRPVLACRYFLLVPLPFPHRPFCIALRQCRRVPSYRELNGGFRKNGKSLRACQSDVRGFVPIWLMMIHCSISLESWALGIP